jgi:hypothetical protein
MDCIELGPMLTILNTIHKCSTAAGFVWDDARGAYIRRRWFASEEHSDRKRGLLVLETARDG